MELHDSAKEVERLFINNALGGSFLGRSKGKLNPAPQSTGEPEVTQGLKLGSRNSEFGSLDLRMLRAEDPELVDRLERELEQEAEDEEATDQE